MFNDKVRAEYQSIKAPDELYERIMNTEPAREEKAVVVQFRKIAAMAAALAVIIATGFVLSMYDKAPVIYMGSERLTGEIALTQAENDGIMLARMSNEVSCEIVLELKKETTVALSQGILLSQSGEVLLEENESKEFSGTLRCNWVVPAADEDVVYEMTLSDNKGLHNITLYFDRQTDNWTVCMTK